LIFAVIFIAVKVRKA